MLRQTRSQTYRGKHAISLPRQGAAGTLGTYA